MSGFGESKPGTRRTYLLVHGAWHGDWCWRAVADRLRAAGHRVLAPTLTGLGERADRLSGHVTLDTHIADILETIAADDLREIVLVGHSFGGAVVLGVADRVPERIRQLVLLDAVILENGQSIFDTMAPHLVEGRRRAVRERGAGLAFPIPPVTAFGIPADHPEAAWVEARLTPHPVGTYESPLRLASPPGHGRPCLYVHCTDPSYAPLESARALARRQPGWAWREIATGHDAMITAPEAVSSLLLERPRQGTLS